MIKEILAYIRNLLHFHTWSGYTPLSWHVYAKHKLGCFFVDECNEVLFVIGYLYVGYGEYNYICYYPRLKIVKTTIPVNAHYLFEIKNKDLIVYELKYILLNSPDIIKNIKEVNQKNLMDYLIKKYISYINKLADDVYIYSKKNYKARNLFKGDFQKRYDYFNKETFGKTDVINDLKYNKGA